MSDEDILQTYLTEEMPLYVSLINFLKTVFTKMHLKDANGLIGVLPIDFDIDDYEPDEQELEEIFDELERENHD